MRVVGMKQDRQLLSVKECFVEDFMPCVVEIFLALLSQPNELASPVPQKRMMPRAPAQISLIYFQTLPAL